MKLWSSQSISDKFMRMTLMVSGTALLLAYISFLVYDLYNLRRELITATATEANIVGANSVTALLFDDKQAAENTLSALRNSPQVRAAVILRTDGTEFARYQRDAAAPFTLDYHLALGETRQYWSRGRDILVGTRIDFQGGWVGTVYLLAETGNVARRVERFGLISAVMLLICFAVALLATSTVRHLVTDPLTGLARTAQVVTREKDYSVRAKIPPSSDELSFLVQSFNEMLEQIQARDRALELTRSDLERRVEERTAELSSTNKELEAFSYSVAHDLRGPLQHINNIGFLLQHSASERLNAEGRMLVDRLLEGSKRMSVLIDDLLNLSRASSHPLHRTPIDLSHTVQTIATRLREEGDGREVQFQIAKGARVIADESLMQVVLENLLGNAWKYTSKVGAAEIEFGYTEEPDGTVYFVRDNGAGFNPRYADRLFRPFQRLHSQSEFTGTGVGLATAYRIITRHGGKIWARGNVDQGASFFFTLPYTES
ncbi:CHASE sensor domain-containing protein [Telmatobacter sp. DSM 110680]|uniref:histidine kinase n=1 Tax=Telmatobacter sp. DSM 110680 TaxID=3036704 RepID=A0AAU7DML9_9BACT